MKQSLLLHETGKRCPYCNSKPVYVDSLEVYGVSYGMIYLCRPCSAWVGVHAGTSIPLGRLANEELRESKKLAHLYFDNLWHRRIKQGVRKQEARTLAYKWLSRQMGVNIKRCHIGMFDVEQCLKVVEVCKPYFISQFRVS